MKINLNAIHILEELSEKNYGIMLSIKNIIDYTKKYFQACSEIITQLKKRNFFFKKKKIYVLKKRIFSINKILFLIKIIKENNIIHVHGLWNITNILSILISIILKKKLLIHVHGMLLNEALNNSILIKKIIKILIIYFLNIVIKNKCTFVAITKKEKESINHFFNNTKIIEVPNPVEAIKIKKKINYNKTFVYFGRVNKIKNLDLIINAFLKARINKNFKLNLYLINDDEILKKKIKLQIQRNKKIILKKPVYGKNKEKILQKSWANILLSKSEVLSYSVLEASINELPSLVNKSICIKNFSNNGGIVVNEEINIISKKIETISRWSLKERKTNGISVRKFIINKFSKDKLLKKYEHFYKV